MIADVLAPVAPAFFSTAAVVTATVAARRPLHDGGAARVEAIKQVMRADFRTALCAWSVWLLAVLEVGTCTAYPLFALFLNNTLLLPLAGFGLLVAITHGGCNLWSYSRSPMMFLLFQVLFQIRTPWEQEAGNVFLCCHDRYEIRMLRHPLLLLRSCHIFASALQMRQGHCRRHLRTGTTIFAGCLSK